MPRKTYEELVVQNDNLIKANGNEEITGPILNGHLRDFLDSLKFDTGVQGVEVYLNSQTNSSPNVSGTYTGVTINQVPINQVSVYVNGKQSSIGTSVSSKFYFKDPTGVIVRGLNEIEVGDFLHYNSGTLTYSLDNTDEITITYITQV